MGVELRIGGNMVYNGSWTKDMGNGVYNGSRTKDRGKYDL